MSKGLKQLFPGLVWLAVLAGLAVALVLILSGRPSWRIAQTLDTPTTEPTTAEATAETPTTIATTEPTTVTVEATTPSAETPTETPTIVPTTETVTPISTETLTPAPTETLAPQSTAETVLPTMVSPIQTPTPAEEPPNPLPIPPTLIPVPTETPWTPTPRPTPTQRPGPTATPFPTHGPSTDAAGLILYGLPVNTLPDEQGAGQVIKVLSTDGQGQKITEPTPISLGLDSNPTYLDPPSPDGRYLLSRIGYDGRGIPYVFDWQTQQSWPLLKGHPMQPYIFGRSYAWHPDSRQVLFWFANNDELWLVNMETGEYTVLALTWGAIQGAAISPDGQWIAYIGNSEATDAAMWLVSTSGGDPKRLLNSNVASSTFGWSPDGQYILYAGGPDTSQGETTGGPLWLIDPSSQNRRPLAGPAVLDQDLQPTWSPDSQWVAYTGLEQGQSYESFKCAQKNPQPNPTCLFEGTAIYIENIQTGEVRRLASGINPTWAPDGSLVAFLSNQSGVPGIWTIHSDGSGLQQLTADGKLIWQIYWWKPIGR